MLDFTGDGTGTGRSGEKRYWHWSIGGGKALGEVRGSGSEQEDENTKLVESEKESWGNRASVIKQVATQRQRTGLRWRLVGLILIQ